jgi:hypothetical protein
MGLLESEFQFTGSLGNVTAYRMRGVDRIVVRKKSGVSKERIQNDRSFARTRENNVEFKGRAKAVRRVRLAIGPLLDHADYNFFGNLNRTMKYVQNGDAVNPGGERSILMSKYGTLLEGFSLNRYSALETLIAAPLAYTVSPETFSAKVGIPQLVPQINFFPPQKHQFFKLTAVLSVVPDLFNKGGDYQPSDDDRYPVTPSQHYSETEWLNIRNGCHATTLEMQLAKAPVDHSCAFVLAIGITFGALDGEKVKRIRHTGSARIVKVVGNEKP